MPATVRGVNAALKHGYICAAAIEGFAVARSAGEWVLVATVVAKNDFALTQRPLSFEVPTQAGLMFWPVESFTIEKDTLRARLGAPLE
jgi:hypothetical protein